MSCIKDCYRCKEGCETYGCYMFAAEDQAVKRLEDRIVELEWEANLAYQAHSHTGEELEEEFYGPIRELKEKKYQLEAFLGLL